MRLRRLAVLKIEVIITLTTRLQAVIGKIVVKSILRIENKIVFKTILEILLQNSF